MLRTSASRAAEVRVLEGYCTLTDGSNRSQMYTAMKPYLEAAEPLLQVVQGSEEEPF